MQGLGAFAASLVSQGRGVGPWPHSCSYPFIPRGVVAAGTFHRDAGRGVHTALSIADAAQVEPSILLPHPLNAQPLVEVRQINPCKAKRVVVVTHKEWGLIYWTHSGSEYGF